MASVLHLLATPNFSLEQYSVGLWQRIELVPRLASHLHIPLLTAIAKMLT